MSQCTSTKYKNPLYKGFCTSYFVLVQKGKNKIKNKLYKLIKILE